MASTEVREPATGAAAPRVSRRRATATPDTAMTPDERAALGAEARARVPLAEHAAFEAGSDRADPVQLLEDQAPSRLAELIPIRYGRMLASPFAFYRGAAAVMAADLAASPVSGLSAQACGDAHLMNFGMFASPDRSLVFDVNDFDETYPGPWEWDVKRLAASLVVAARGNGFTSKEARKIVTSAVGKYRETMATFAGQTNLDVWYARADFGALSDQLAIQLGKQQVKKVKRAAKKAREHDSMQALGKLATTVDGTWRIKADPPFVVPISDILPEVEGAQLAGLMRELLASYAASLDADRRVLLSQFHFADLARKVVGVGSVGTRCWIALFRGRDEQDPLFLQVKEAQASVLAAHLPHQARAYDNEGERVVSGQRLMQAASDIFLGWIRTEGIDGQVRDFYFRQLRDWKMSLDATQMIPSGMDAYGQACAWTLARAHARSGDRIAIAAYLGGDATFDNAVAAFAEKYADQNEADYAALQEAASTGRITVATRIE